MVPTTLCRLLASAAVHLADDGLSVAIDPEWVIVGENRLSYTSQVALIECCREHHWQLDIAPHSIGQVDSTTRMIMGDFARPLLVGTRILVQYRVTEVRRRSYRLHFTLRSAELPTAAATQFDMVCVFVDPVNLRAIEPPEVVLVSLRFRQAQPASG